MKAKLKNPFAVLLDAIDLFEAGCSTLKTLRAMNVFKLNQQQGDLLMLARHQLSDGIRKAIGDQALNKLYRQWDKERKGKP